MFWKKLLIALFILLTAAVAAGPATGGDRFEDHGDGTVTDRLLNLMWAKTDNQGDIDWKGAVRWARFTFPLSLPEGKREGWRLPAVEELQSLFVSDDAYEGYETDCGRQVYMVPQIELSCGWVWSGERRNITARVFNFERGYHYTDRMVHRRAYRALPVRDLKP